MHLSKIYMPLKWIGRIEIIITMGNLDIWQEIVEIEEQEAKFERVEDWNMEMEIMDRGE